MKNSMTRLLCGAAVLAAFAAGFIIPNHSAEAATAAVSVTGNLYIPLSVTSTTPIAFGNIIMDPAGDTVTLNRSTSALTDTAGTTYTGTASHGTIVLAGTGTASISITAPSAIDVALGGANYHIENFTFGAGTQSLVAGALTIDVGADLRYEAAISAGGAISETANFTVDYN